MRLLLAEDEQELSRALVAILKHGGYTVDAVYDGQDAWEYARVGDYDGIILDVMMPKLTGFEVIKRLRNEGISTPILFLTARTGVEDRINGLDLGADDYLPKPFDMGELLARIRAMTRRREEFKPNDLSYGGLTLHRASCEISVEGRPPLRLPGREYQMLEMLMENPGRLISVDSFMERIWADGEADIGVVWVTISTLRKKLQSLDAGVEIKASRGQGYYIQEK